MPRQWCLPQQTPPSPTGPLCRGRRPWVMCGTDLDVRQEHWLSWSTVRPRSTSSGGAGRCCRSPKTPRRCASLSGPSPTPCVGAGWARYPSNAPMARRRSDQPWPTYSGTPGSARHPEDCAYAPELLPAYWVAPSLSGRAQQGPQLCDRLLVAGNPHRLVRQPTPRPEVNLCWVPADHRVRRTCVCVFNPPRGGSARLEDGQPTLVRGRKSDRAVARRRHAQLAQAVTEPQEQQLVDAVEGDLRVDGMHRPSSGSLDVDPMHGGLMCHPTPPEAVRTVGRPPGVARVGWIMPAQLSEQLAESTSHETNQIAVRRRLLPLLGSLAVACPQPGNPMHAAHMAQGLAQCQVRAARDLSLRCIRQRGGRRVEHQLALDTDNIQHPTVIDQRLRSGHRKIPDAACCARVRNSPACRTRSSASRLVTR